MRSRPRPDRFKAAVGYTSKSLISICTHINNGGFDGTYHSLGATESGGSLSSTNTIRGEKRVSIDDTEGFVSISIPRSQSLII